MPKWEVEKQYYEMSEFVGFQTIVILDPNGMIFDAVVALVWPFDIYLNLVHHTVSKYLKQISTYTVNVLLYIVQQYCSGQILIRT